MGFFKKIFPKPKSVLQSPITLIKASPKEKIQSFFSPLTALSHGDIGGALNYGARFGGDLQDQKEAAAKQAVLQQRADAAEAQRQFFSQSPMTPSMPSAPIIPPSYGALDDYIARLNGQKINAINFGSQPMGNAFGAPTFGAPGGYAPPPVPQQQPPMQRFPYMPMPPQVLK